MNQGVLQSSAAVQQMMAGSPNWWNINNMRPPPSQPTPSSFLASPPPPNLFPHHYSPAAPPPPPTTSSAATLLPLASWDDHNQEFPESWGQLLLGGLVGEEGEDKSGLSINMQQQANKKFENWEHQLLDQTTPTGAVVGVKQESSLNSYVYGGRNVEFQAKAAKPTWSSQQMMIPVSSPKSSCVTTLSSNMLDFSTKSEARHPPPDHSSECNSTATGGAAKKARVHPTATQSTFKVRKEKLGDRITALHQLVSPFGKTDTASVLLEAIGYIRFLQSQIEALSLPYLGSASGNMRQQQQQQPVQAGERNCLFPEDPGQLLNDNRMKKKAPSDQDSHEAPKKDLRSRGLCLVPVSCTLQVGSDNGADYWAPAFNGGLQ